MSSDGPSRGNPRSDGLSSARPPEAPPPRTESDAPKGPPTTDDRAAVSADGLDAAGTFLKRLEQVDVEHLDISELLKDLDDAISTGRGGTPSVAQTERTTASPESGTAPRDGLKVSGETAKVEAGGRTSVVPALRPGVRVHGSDARPPSTTYAESARAPGRSSEDPVPTVDSKDSSTQRKSWNPGLVIGGGVVLVLALAMVVRSSFSKPTTTDATVAPRASASPASTVGAVSEASAAARIDAQVAAFTNTARQLYAAGHRSEALDAMSQGFGLHPDDSALKELLAQAVGDMQHDYDAARRAARAVNATGTPRYVEAEGLVRDPSRRQAAPTVDSAKAYLAAVAAMNAAAEDTRTRAEARVNAAASAPIAAAPGAENGTRTTAAPVSVPASGNVTPSLPPTLASAPVPAPAPARQAPTAQARIADATAPDPEVAVQRPPATPPALPPAVPPAVPQTTQAPPLDASPATRESTTPARLLASDEQAIRTVLQAYAAAHSRLDANAVRAVYPSTDAVALQRSFSRMRSQRVQIINEQIQVSGASATVTCIWQTVFELNAGAPNRSAPQTTLTLQRSGDSWIIVGRR